MDVVQLNEETVKAIANELAKVMAMYQPQNKENNRGFFINLLKDFLPVLALIIGAVWFLFNEIDKKATPDDIEKAVSAKLTEFELKLTKEQFNRLTEKMIKIENKIDQLAIKVGLPAEKSERVTVKD